MLPDFDLLTGYLPLGVHAASWSEVRNRFGTNVHRSRLLEGLERALRNLAAAGCRSALIDGSFVSAKPLPNDYDVAWDPTGVDPDRLDPVLLDMTNSRGAMKAKYGGEFFPASAQAAPGICFRDFLPDRSGRHRQGCSRSRSWGNGMITNERQYRITAAKVERFQRALERTPDEQAGRSNVHPRLLQAEREGLESQLADLRRELGEYEALKRGAVSSITVDSFDDLGLGLIKARIAAGLSQKALATRLGVKEQQIQRYEAERYVSASYRRLQEIVRALGVSITKEIRHADSSGAQAASTSDPLLKKA